MALKILRKNWDDKSYRELMLGVAEILHEDIDIIYSKNVRPYNVQIWKDDNIILERNFAKRPQALKWIKKVLVMRKCKDAYADLKKFNKKGDDFDYWYYKLENKKVVEVFSI